MLKFIQSILIVILMSNTSYAQGKVFYQDPSVQAVKDIIDFYANNAEATASNAENLGKNLTVIFYFYPDLIQDITAIIPNYSELIQKAISQAIVNNKGWYESLPVKYQNLQKSKLNMNVNFLIYSGPDDSNFNLMLTEFFVQSYYISSDKKYLEKILKFVSNFPKDVKNAAHKIIYDNPSPFEIDDLYGAMNAHHTDLTHQLINVIKYIDAKRIDQPVLDQAIQEIISSNQSFDYRKGI